MAAKVAAKVAAYAAGRRHAGVAEGPGPRSSCAAESSSNARNGCGDTNFEQCAVAGIQPPLCAAGAQDGSAEVLRRLSVVAGAVLKA